MAIGQRQSRPVHRGSGPCGPLGTAARHARGEALKTALSSTNPAARQCTAIDFQGLMCDCPNRNKSALQARIEVIHAEAIRGPFSSQDNAGHRAGGHGFGAGCQENTVEALQSLLARDRAAPVATLAYVEFDIHVRARRAAATDRCMLAGRSTPCSPPAPTRRCLIQDRCLHLIGGSNFRYVIHQCFRSEWWRPPPQCGGASGRRRPRTGSCWCFTTPPLIARCPQD